MEPAEYALMASAEDEMWWYQALHARLIEAVADVHGTLLDAGCGTGGFLAKLRRRRSDLRAVGCEWAEEGAKRSACKSDATIVRGSVDQLPFATGSFDGAVAADVLCHAAVDPPRALAELLRVLRPGGTLVLNLPAFAWLASAHDRRVHNARRYTAGEVRRMLAGAGFSVVRVGYWNSLLLPLMVLHRKLQRESAETVSDVHSFGPCLNAFFRAITQVEHATHLALPAGGSVIATARKPLH